MNVIWKGKKIYVRVYSEHSESNRPLLIFEAWNKSEWEFYATQELISPLDISKEKLIEALTELTEALRTA